jgi:hypothetical protein
VSANSDPLQRKNLRGFMSILFCTPCYGGKLDEPHFISSMALKEELLKTGMPHDWLTGKNESLVHRARMEMNAMFLATNFTHKMWIDADIGHTPADVAALWNLNADIAVAFYAMKRSDMPLSAWHQGKIVKLDECPKEPFPVDFAGTGFMLIKRSAIETIVAHIEKKEKRAKELLAQIACADDFDKKLISEMSDAMASSYEGPNGRVPALYTAHIFNDGLESEDYHFCRVAREAGLQIIGNPSIRLKHYGQYAYGA